MKNMFSGNLPFEIDSLKNRIVTNKAAAAIVDGAVGEGKTTMAVGIADYYEGQEIDLNVQYAMGGDQFKEKLLECIKLKKKTIIYDEAGDFSKRGFMTSFNKFLDRVFEIYRTFKILVIIVLPVFSDLDGGLFEKGIPRLLVHCYGRTLKSGKYCTYSLWRMGYLKYRMQKIPVRREVYKMVKGNAYGNFKDLPDHRKELIDKLSTDGKLGILEQNNIHQKGLLSYKQIAQAMNVTKTYVSKIVNEMKIKHDMMYKGIKYFDKHIIQLIEERK